MDVSLRRHLKRLRHESWVLIREHQITDMSELRTDKMLAQLNLRTPVRLPQAPGLARR